MNWQTCEYCNKLIDNGPSCTCECAKCGTHPNNCECDAEVIAIPMSPYDLSRGDQIMHVPTHAHGSIYHNDCEKGFVTSVKGNTVFCRYFNKKGELRTKANSEGCNWDMLVLIDTKPQNLIDELLENMP